jgi:hypothetical protein
MAIDDINPPGAYRPPDLTAEVPGGRAGNSGYADVEHRIRRSPCSDATAPLAGAATQFSRAIFGDPAQLDRAVRSVAVELVDEGRGLGATLSAIDSEHLVDFMAGDSVFRQQIESYLRKVVV